MSPARHIVILGAGTAGTTVANRLRRACSPDRLRITLVDRDDVHVYQPGLLFLPFGTYRPRHVLRSRHAHVGDGIDLVLCEIDRVDPAARTVHLADGRALAYDDLVVATGVEPRPDQTPGLPEALAAGVAHEFYTYDGARRLAEAMRRWRRGHLVVHVVEMPIKCPVAPLEFAFLLDGWLREKKARSATRITYATPLDAAFTKPVASRELGDALRRRDIALEADVAVAEVDGPGRRLVTYDGRELGFDLLVTVPVTMGAAWVARSGMGDEANLVECDRHTMKALHHDDVWVLGDAGTLPTSKAGSVAHFAVDTFVPNYLAHLDGREPPARFDGHANCFVESGGGKAMLLDFSYDTEPLTGVFPLPVVGPFSLLRESRANHLGKLAFRWAYWNLLLPGRRLPLPSAMTMAGKRVEKGAPTRPAAASPHPTPAAEPTPVVRPAAAPRRAEPRGRPTRTPTAGAPTVSGQRQHWPPDPRRGVDSTADPATVLDAPIVPRF